MKKLPFYWNVRARQVASSISARSKESFVRRPWKAGRRGKCGSWNGRVKERWEGLGMAETKETVENAQVRAAFVSADDCASLFTR